MKRIAVVDVGTNTVLLTVVERTEEGGFQVLHDEQRFGRLGQGVDASRRILPEAMQRVRDVLLDYQNTCLAFGVSDVWVGGTSASRDAHNQAELTAYMRAETGWDYHLVSGEKEAEWSFRGALALLPEVREACVVLDIGGGSTEVILGDAASGSIQYRRSFDAGSIRIRERFMPDLPVSPQALADATTFVQNNWYQVAAENPVLPDENRTLIAVAGVGTALALLESGADDWDVRQVTQNIIPTHRLEAWFSRVKARSAHEVLALNEGVLFGRQDVLIASLLLLHSFATHFGFPQIHISTGGWRHGRALEMLDDFGG